MGDNINRATREVPDTATTDLRTQLNKAYLSGDGAAVERVMALMAANEKRPRQDLGGKR
jgi:hypothetical protein